MKHRNCPFCGTDFAAMLTDEATEWRNVSSRRLASVGAFSLCAGLGPIVEPYVLAYPNEHYTAISELDGILLHDLLDVLDLCIASGLFPSRYLSVFEHGGPAQGSSACLEHCHLHIVDGFYDLQHSLAQALPQSRSATISETAILDTTPGYLFAGLYHGRREISGRLAEKPECGGQFLRRLLAAQIHSCDWNWRLSPKPDRALHLCMLWPERAKGGVSRRYASE